MKKITAYILIGCLVLALLFNFAAVYDYTFDASTPVLDLTEARDINAGLLSSCFVKIVNFGEKLVSYLNSAVQSVYKFFKPFETSAQIESDLERIEKIRETSVVYVEENYKFINRLWMKNNLKSFINFLKKPNVFFSYRVLTFTTYDLEETCSVYGISDEDKVFLHDYFDRLHVRHIYEGRLYTY